MIAWISFFYSQIHYLSEDYQKNVQIFKLLLEGFCSKKMIAKMFVVFLFQKKNQPKKSNYQ